MANYYVYVLSTAMSRHMHGYGYLQLITFAAVIQNQLPLAHTKQWFERCYATTFALDGSGQRGSLSMEWMQWVWEQRAALGFALGHETAGPLSAPWIREALRQHTVKLQPFAILQYFRRAPAPQPDSTVSVAAAPALPWSLLYFLCSLLDFLYSPIPLSTIAEFHRQQRPFPETLYLYAGDLAALRDMLDAVVVKASLIIVLKQTWFRLSKRIAGTMPDLVLNPAGITAAVEAEFLKRIDALLQSADLAFSAIVTECTVFLKELFLGIVRGRPSSPRGASSSDSLELSWIRLEVDKELTSALKDIFSDKHAVFKLFSKRVQRVMLLAMCVAIQQSDCWLGKALVLTQHPLLVSTLQANSLASPHQVHDLSLCVHGLWKVFRHTVSVHGLIYDAMLAEVCGAVSSTS